MPAVAARCNAARPVCNFCEKRNIPCQYEAHVGETSVQALKRKFDELDPLDGACARVGTALRDRPGAEASAILSRLRRPEDIHTLARRIEHGDLLLQVALAPETNYRYDFPFRSSMPAHLMTPDNYYLESLVYEWAPNRFEATPAAYSMPVAMRDPYLKPYHAAKLVVPQLELVTPSKWTTVSADDSLMRTVLAAFLVQECSWFTVFHPHGFLDDMANMRNDLCSSLLVNSVLALTCHCYRGLPQRSEYWNPETLGYRFFEEAKHLWKQERDSNTLTSIQAAILFNTYYAACGLDKVGWTYTLQAMQMAYNVDLFNGCPQLGSKRLCDAASFTAWAVFSWQSLMSFHFLQAPLLDRPPSVPLPDPMLNPEWYGQIWLQYPDCNLTVSAQFELVFKASCDFRIILNDLGQALIEKTSDEKVLTFEQLVTFRTRFKQWENGLPPALSSHRIVLPAQLMLHMHHQLVLINMSSPFIGQPDATKAVGSQESPLAAFSTAKIRLETLARLYYLRHGFEHQDSVLIAVMISCGLMAIQEIGALLNSSPNVSTAAKSRLDDLRSTVVLMAKGLYDQGMSFFIAKATFRLFSHKMRPEERNSVWQFAKVEDDVSPDLSAKYIQSNFPIDIVRASDNPDAQRLSVALQQCRLELDSSLAAGS